MFYANPLPHPLSFVILVQMRSKRNMLLTIDQYGAIW